MDFHTLTRRELQALCKKNKIPANITNVAMADALKALEFVEGIEEVMKPSESETANSSAESPGKSDIMSSVPRTARRTANRKTAKKESEMSQIVTRSRRSTRRIPPQNLDEVKNEVIETPAAPTTRRRAAATSVSSKLESLLKECVDKEEDGEQVLNEKKGLPNTTPGAVLTSRRREVKEKSSVLQVYSNRRSARLAAKYVDESSKQDIEISQTVTVDSFTDETDEILEVNSKLSSLHWDEELRKAAADSSALYGNENQNVASKDLKVDMHQSSEEFATKEITDGLIDNYGLSAGKELNDVEVDLQQGADLQLKGREVVGDNMAVSAQLDDEDEPEVPNTGEVSECVFENAGALCGVEVAGDYMVGPDEPKTNEISRCEVEDGAHFKGQEVCGDEKVLPMQFDGENEDKNAVENAGEVSECVFENAGALCGEEVAGDYMVGPDEPKTNEISRCEVEDGAHFKGQEVCGDEKFLPMQFDGENEDNNAVENAGEVSECVFENAGALCGVEVASDYMVGPDEPKTNEISRCEVEDGAHFKGQEVCGDEKVLPMQFDGENEGNNAVEIADVQPKGKEVFGDNTVQCKHLDDENKLQQGTEISQSEDKNVDALCKEHKLAVDEMVLLSKQLDDEEEADTNGISDCEVEGVNLQPKCQEVVSSEMVLPKQLDAKDAHDEELDTKETPNTVRNSKAVGISDCEVEDCDALCKGIEVVCNDVVLRKQLGEVNTKENSNTEVEVADLHCEGSEIVGDGIALPEQLDNEEISNTEVEDADLHCKGQEIVGDGMALPNQGDNDDEQFNDEGKSINDIISSETNVDAARAEKLVQEYENPANKDVVDAPVLLASLPPQAHAPSSTVMLDPAHVPSNKTPMKQPVSKTTAAATNIGVNCVSDDKENIHNSGIKLVLTKEKMKKKGNAEVKNQIPLEDLSLRKLTKMMKEKLQIAEKITKAVSRPALQEVQENCLVGESRNSSED